MEAEFILDQMQASAEPFAVCQLHGRCELGLDKGPSATLHYVLSGCGEIVLSGQAAMKIQRGSLVLIPALSSHVLRSFGELSDPIPVCRPTGLELAHLIQGEPEHGGGQLVAICSRISLSLRSLHNLIDLVRAPIAETVDADSFLALPVQAILRELADPGPGSMAMIRALLLVSTIELMRRRLAAQDHSLSWMAALRDQKLWPAVREMLDAPEKAHSLESLAEIAGMSRSAFSKHFADAYGGGPIELLRDLRMQRAAARLLETDLPVKRIAEMSGFRSRSAFTRAFDGAMGVSPKEYRARAGAAPWNAV